MKTKIALLIGFILILKLSFSQNHAFEMNARLGNGINLGNAFEAPSLGEWGVVIYEDYFKELKDKGFGHVRIPVKWSAHSMETAPYTIEQWFLDTVKWAVDLCLQNDLPVIIDIHHYDEMFETPLEHEERFLAIWKQLSDSFEGYSDSLYFELMNEPHNDFTPEIWNDLLIKGLEVVREKHPTRMVLIGTPEYGGIGGLSKLEIPETDTNLIVTIHYYNPFTFTHQGATWAGVTATNVSWDSTAAQINAVKADFNVIKNYSNANNVPIHIGEYGAIQNADNKSRARWAGHLRSQFEAYGFSSAYWEYASGFGIYNPGLDCYYNDVLFAITGVADDCDCSKFDTVIVKNSEFNRGYTPWNLNKNTATVAADIQIIDSTAQLTVTKVGTEDWHIQFSYTNVTLTYGSTYTFEFEAYADSNLWLISQIGLNGGDWAVYNTARDSITTQKTKFSRTFTYLEPTNKNMRIVFELGKIGIHTLYLDNIHLYETVKGIPVEEIVIFVDNVDSFYIKEPAGSIELQAEVLPQDASLTDITWTITKGASLASISEEGIVTSNNVGNGTVEVTATAKDGSGIIEKQNIIIQNQENTAYNFISDDIYVTVNSKIFKINAENIKNITAFSITGQECEIEIENIDSKNFTIKTTSKQEVFFLRIVTEKGIQTIKI